MPIELPPLRERREDLPALIELFLERFAQRLERDLCTIAPEAQAALSSHTWPGNIRELENVIERATLLCDGGQIRVEDLPAEIRCTAQSGGTGEAPLRERVRSATRLIEREAILEALASTRGNVTRAARQLGMSRRGLQLKMKELGIERPGAA